jgi:hypothetical protein
MIKEEFKTYNENLLAEIGISREEYSESKKRALELSNMLDNLQVSILDELVKYKEENQLTNKELGEKLNTKSNSYVRTLLDGTANISLETITRIAKVIGKNPSFNWK